MYINRKTVTLLRNALKHSYENVNYRIKIYNTINL